MYKVYCDFDETVTARDVVNQVLGRFGTPLAMSIWDDFRAGTRSAVECYRIACSTVSIPDLKQYYDLLDKQKLREGFIAFLEFCRTNSIDLKIASDGFSSIIRNILAAHSIADIPVWTNEIELTESGNLSVKFPHEREGCNHCASCKCALLLTTSDDSDTIVYVGDGYSDWCPASMADVVFATRELPAMLAERGIPHHPFRDFHEVQTILSTYLKDRPKYRREQAHRRRKELIMME